MMQKLLAFVNGKIAADSLDVPSNQEILLPGHVYLNIFQVNGEERGERER
jgi:hypothetical protein